MYICQIQSLHFDVALYSIFCAISNYIISVYRRTKIFDTMPILVSIGPTAEELGAHKSNMNDKEIIL